MNNLDKHNLQTKKIAEEIRVYCLSTQKKKLRFYHGETNSTREQNKEDYFWVDISGLDKVIEVNKKAGYALVEPNVPMDKLVETTLQFGLIPKVVMEFPGITCGGAVNGATLESSSFKYGQFNDNCAEYEIIPGNGEIIKASEKQNADLFLGISGSYGTLGLISLIKVLLIPAAKYVETTFSPQHTWGETLSFIRKQTNNSGIDFIDGIVFGPENAVVITGKLLNSGNSPLRTYTKASDYWFYDRARQTLLKNNSVTELVPIVDYLFRYNRGAFWMGEYVFPMLRIPSNGITKFLFNPVMNTRKLHDGMAALNIGQNYFVQDFYCQYHKVLDFLSYSDKHLGIYPIWLCPILSARSSQKLSPHYLADEMLIDIGIWGQTEKYRKNPIGVNLDFERFATENNSRKMLYAHVYYSQDKFWNIYDKKWYDQLRKKYKADKIFPDVWTKVHVSGKYKVEKWKGTLKMLRETIQGKHINS